MRLVLTLALVTALQPVPATLQDSPEPASADLPETVELVPLDGTTFSWGRGEFVGPLEVRAAGAGLGLVETLPPDEYLTGLREVPLSWPDATLEAQAIAARTFLTWSIERGRSGGARTYGYDICATQACQVYRGSAIAAYPEAAAWVAAVARTSGQVLLFEGAPAHTFYSSSAGSRTRPVQDIWGGSGAPYLVAVDSPEAGITPYEEWVVEIPAGAMQRVLIAGGIDLRGRITDVAVDRPVEGGGRSAVVFTTEAGIVRVGVSRFRAILNIHGPVLYPGLLPGTRPDGRRWPQAVLSYTFDASWQGEDGVVPERLIRLLPPSDLPDAGTIRIVGEGWGHGVGMSQWGAKAMGDLGATSSEILAHYYGGLRPERVALPDLVRVGLAQDRAILVVEASGPFELRANGWSLGVVDAGAWQFLRSGSGVVIGVEGERRPGTDEAHEPQEPSKPHGLWPE